MRARHIIGNATFGPAALAVIGAAFDQAWADVEDHFDTDLSREAARLTLASAILANATDDSRDVDALKRAGLCVLAAQHHLAFASLDGRAQLQRTRKAIEESRRQVAKSRDQLLMLKVSIRRTMDAMARASDLLTAQSSRPFRQGFN